MYCFLQKIIKDDITFVCNIIATIMSVVPIFTFIYNQFISPKKNNLTEKTVFKNKRFFALKYGFSFIFILYLFLYIPLSKTFLFFIIIWIIQVLIFIIFDIIKLIMVVITEFFLIYTHEYKLNEYIKNNNLSLDEIEKITQEFKKQCSISFWEYPNIKEKNIDLSNFNFWGN